MAAGVDQAAADKGEIGGLVIGEQFAHAVANPDLGVGVDGLAAAAFLYTKAELLRAVESCLKAFGVARNDDEQAVGGAVWLLLPSAQDEFGFVAAVFFAGAGGDPDGAGADELAQGLGLGGGFGRRGDVVFGVAADLDVGGAELLQPAGISGGLGINGGERLQGGGDEGADALVAALRLFGQAGVGEEQGNVVAAAGGNQVGPDFGFHQNAAAGLVFAQKLFDPVGTVIRQIAALGVWIECLGGGAAGGGHLGEQQRGLGQVLLQGVNQRGGGTGFAYGYGMNPDSMAYGVGMGLAEAFALVQGIVGIETGALLQTAFD